MLREIKYLLLSLLTISSPLASADEVVRLNGLANTFNIELTPVWNQLRLTPQKIFTVEALLTPAEASWKQLFKVEGTTPAYFGLVAEDEGFQSITHSLILRFAPQTKSGVRAELCQAGFSRCTIAQASEAGRASLIPMGASALQVLPEPNPCVLGSTCTVTIPSWALQNFFLNKGFSQAPHVMGVVHYASGIALIDAQNGRVFVNLPGGKRLANLGPLQQVFANVDGTLRLNFRQGIVLIDFRRDQILVAKSDGLTMGVYGVAAGLAGEFAPIHEAVNQLGQPLHLSGTVAFWSHAILPLQRIDNAIPTQLQVVNELPTQMDRIIPHGTSVYGVAATSAAETVLLIYRNDIRQFVRHSSFQLRGGANQLANTVVVGTDIFQLTTDGYFHLSNGGLRASNLLSKEEAIHLHEAGHGFRARHRSDGCTLEHMVWDSATEVFQPTSLVLPCGTQGRVRISSDGLASVELNGNRLITHIWTPLPVESK